MLENVCEPKESKKSQQKWSRFKEKWYNKAKSLLGGASSSVSVFRKILSLEVRFICKGDLD